MKNLILIISLSLISVFSYAQFEGEIKYSIQITGDKQIEEQKAFLPTHYRMIFKQGNSKFIQEGGMMAAMMGDIINMNDGKTYFVNHMMKTVNSFTPESMNTGSIEKPTIVKEKETVTILGYKCQKYKIITNPGKKEETAMFIWASKDLKPASQKSSKFGAGQYSFEGVDGMALKMELNMSGQGINMQMIMTAVNVSTTAPADAEFELPSDYEKQEGLPEMLKMMQGNK
jgi:hypothetical protein